MVVLPVKAFASNHPRVREKQFYSSSVSSLPREKQTKMVPVILSTTTMRRR